MACAFRRSRHLARQVGFTLLEVLISLVVGLPLLAGLGFAVVAVFRAAASERVAVEVVLDGQAGPTRLLAHRGPTPGVEADAAVFHALFMRKVSRATAVYVFGANPVGINLNTEGGTRAAIVRPLRLHGWVNLPTKNIERTPREFLDAYQSVLGEEVSLGVQGFTVVVVGARASGSGVADSIGITAIAQVIHQPARADARGDPIYDGGAILQWARLWTEDSDGPYAEYAWVTGGALPPELWPRASQYWRRVDDRPLINLFDPGPAVCRFPDPVPPIDGVGGGSRFTYTF